MKKFRRKVLDMLMSNNSGSSLRQQLLDGAPFCSELLYTAVPQRAASGTTGTFTRATTSTWPNNDGYLVTGVAGEIGFVGARRVRNLFSNTSWIGGTSGTLGSGGVAPTGWTALGGTGSITFADSAVHSGSKSIRFQATAQRPYIQQSIAVAASSVYMLLVTVEAAATANLLSNLLAIATAPAGATSVYLKNGVVVDGPTTTASAGDVIGMRLTVSSTAGTPDWRVGLGSAGSPTGDVTLAGPRLVDVTAETDQTTPREYVSVGVASAPYFHGSFVDGVRCYSTALDGSPIPSSTLLGYQAEGARTNLCLQSNDPSNASWTKSSFITTTQNAVSPDGATNAWTIAATTGATFAVFLQNITVAADTNSYTASCFVKKTTGTPATYPMFELQHSSATKTAGVVINTTAGTLTNRSVGGAIVAPDAKTIVSWDDDWWRVTVTLANNSGTTSTIAFYPSINSDGTGVIVSGTLGSAVFYGAQLELGSFASSYIPTTTIAVARNADVLTYSSAGNIDGTKGCAYAELSTEYTTAPGYLDAVSSGAGTGIQIMGIASGAASTTRFTTDTSTLLTKSGLSDMSTGPRKTSVTWGGATYSITGDGATPASAAFDGTMATTASIGIGCNSLGTGNWFGTIRNVRIWQRQLSASEMQAITS